MKHAYLIIAHNNWWQLKNLITLLDHTGNDIYIHVDKKVKDFNEEEFKDLTNNATVNIFREYKVYWGGYSIVEVEMFLFEKASKNKYDYYHLLSGMDLPLKTNAQINEFFEKHNGKQFIEFCDNRLSDPEIQRRTKLYHFLQNKRRVSKHKLVNGFYTFCERCLLGMQLVLGVNRTRKLDWEIRYGSQWVSVTNDFVNVLLSQRNKINKVFSRTNCADELFIQTVAYNCGFRDKLYIKDNQTCNLRYIDWNRGSNGNPWTFRKEDLSVLTKTDALFARKFSESIDKDIITEISKRVSK